MEEIEKMIGTCVVRNDDGKLRLVDAQRVVSLIEFTKVSNDITVNIKSTDFCTEDETIIIYELIKEKFGIS